MKIMTLKASSKGRYRSGGSPTGGRFFAIIANAVLERLALNECNHIGCLV